jgi:hypothetical protein
MKMWVYSLVFLAVFAPAAQFQKAQAKPPTRIERAEALYAKRADLGRVREAIRLLAQGQTAGRADFETAWRTAKFCYYLAAHTTEAKEREATFKTGVSAGKAAVALQPARPEGHFWLGANLGKRAELAGGLGALGAVDDVRKAMNAVVKADPGYQGGSAYLILGQIDLKTPALLGGSKRRAVEWMEKGLAFGSQNAFLRLGLAEAYLAVKRGADARRQLDFILEMKPDPDYLPEYEEAVAAARKLLEKGL